MRAIDTSSSSAESEGEPNDEWLEMKRPPKKMAPPDQLVAAGGADGEVNSFPVGLRGGNLRAGNFLEGDLRSNGLFAESLPP